MTQPLFYAVAPLCVLAIALFLFLEFVAPEKLKRFLARHYKKTFNSVSDRYLSLASFADCEKQLSGVSRVIVICSRIERPTNELAKAVIDNFEQGIKYEFFIGKGESEVLHGEYVSWFRAFFDVARLSRPNSSFEDLFSIQRLPIPWHGSPYVFHVNSIGGQEVIHTFRGMDLRSGISTSYERTTLQEAMTIISLCVASSEPFRDALPVDVSADGMNVVALRAS